MGRRRGAQAKPTQGRYANCVAGALTLVPTFASFDFIACLADPIDHRL